MDDDASWRRTWSGLQQRRIFAAGAAAALAITLFLPIVGAIVAIGPFLLAFAALYRWPCPRCRHRFAGVGLGLFRDTCASCGLAAFSPASETQRPIGPLNPRARAVSSELRRLVGGAQVISGVIVGLFSVRYGGSWLVAGLVCAAVLGGVWLWSDAARGYSLTRLLLGLQVVRVISPPVAYGLQLGLSIDWVRRPDWSQLGIGTGAFLVFGRGMGPGWEVTVNLLAFGLLLCLWGAQPHTQHESLGEAPGAGRSH